LLWTTPVVYPFKIFVVLLHEISHAFAALMTGGVVERIMLSPDQGGVTLVRGGNAFIILSAGYLGSLAWGLAMLEASRARPKRVRTALVALTTIVLVTGLVYVRNLFGFVFTILFGAALLFIARRLPTSAQALTLTALGLTSALYAVLDIRSDVLQRPGLPSDAAALADITGIPTLVWGILWIAIAITASFYSTRRVLARI
jgi:hypothetical protein